MNFLLVLDIPNYMLLVYFMELYANLIKFIQIYISIQGISDFFNICKNSYNVEASRGLTASDIEPVIIVKLHYTEIHMVTINGIQM